MNPPRFYRDLADWWPLVSRPEGYASEAAIFRHALEASGAGPVRTVLELGCGGGNNASHLKRHYAMTLTDLEPAMLDVSRGLNPTCEHEVGDMRTLRLERTFDAVLIHDAVAYMTTVEDLRAAFVTAFAHLRPGGVALFAPDDVTETFTEWTDHGGYDGEGRALRFVQWNHDPDPSDSMVTATFVFLLREGTAPIRVVPDEHVLGLFSEDTWLRTLANVGFVPQTLPHPHPEARCDLFLGRKRG